MFIKNTKIRQIKKPDLDTDSNLQCQENLTNCFLRHPQHSKRFCQNYCHGFDKSGKLRDKQTRAKT